MEWLGSAAEVLLRVIEVIADVGTIGAACVAILVFLRNGPELKSLIKTLNNFAHRDSMSELRIKIELVSSLHASDQSNSTEIASLFLEICGQIDGSPFLRDDLSEISSRMKNAASSRRSISEPQKRAILSELREIVRHLDYANFEELTNNAKGGKQ